MKASDPSGDFSTQTVTLSINDLPPVISSPATADVDEAVVAQTAVYTAIAADPAGGTVTWSLVSGLHDDASAFSIDASSGIVTINNVPDFETKPSYTFTVQASDPSGRLLHRGGNPRHQRLPPVISSGAVATAIDEGVAVHTRGLHRYCRRSCRRYGDLVAGVRPQRRCRRVQYRCVDRRGDDQRDTGFRDQIVVQLHGAGERSLRRRLHQDGNARDQRSAAGDQFAHHR